MLGRVVLGGIALATVGFGLAKYFEDECNCSSDTNNELAINRKLTLLYDLKQKVYNSSFKDFQKLIVKVDNLEFEKKDNLTFKDITISTYKNKHKVEDTLLRMYTILEDCHIKLQNSLQEVTNILKVSNNYESYSQETKQTISNSFVVADLIYDILKTPVIKDNQLVDSLDKLVNEFEKILENIDKN